MQHIPVVSHVLRGGTLNSRSLPRKHVAHTIDGTMLCLFTAGEEPLWTGGVQG